MPGSSFRGSSREESISSSIFGDSESFMNDDVPVVISRKATDDWDEVGGLGISNDETLHDSQGLVKAAPPHLLTEHSAPARMEQHKIPLRQRSSDKIRSKKESIEKHRHQCAESGDDEDEELGDTSVREKSPRSAAKTHRTSKLGIEMMRTNSRGSVVSSSDLIPNVDTIELPPLTEELSITSITGALATPPEKFEALSEMIRQIDLDETPRPSKTLAIMEEEPTPRAPSVASNRI